MKSSLETRLGLFFALAFAVAVIILELIGALDLFRPGITIKASFPTVHELKRGDQVKLAGVEIGRVERITLRNHQAVVEMKIHKDFVEQIRTDSKALVKFSGLMGQNFVAIEPGTAEAPVVETDATLVAADQPDLGALMAKLKDVAGSIEQMAKGFSPESFSSMFGPLTDFVKQNSPVLSAVIGNMRTVSDQVAKGEGTVGRLIKDEAFYHSASVTMSNLQLASADLQGLMRRTDDLLAKAGSALDDLKAGKGTLGLLATDEQFYREATGAMTNLHQVLGKINQGQGSVGKMVNDETLLKNLKMSLQKLDKATDSLEDQGPLSVLGLAISTLF